MKLPYYSTLLVLCFMTCISIYTQAQTGYYLLEDKTTDIIKSIELQEDGSFTYIHKGEWSAVKTIGTWKKKGQHSILLNSEYQLDSCLLKEDRDSSQDSTLLITILATNYQRGPQQVEAIILNDNPSYTCQVSQKRILEDAEKRNDIMIRGNRSQRDSLVNAYQPIYYQCKTKGLDSLEQIQVEFDKKKVLLRPSNKAANIFEVTFRLAPVQNYRYFSNETFIVEKRALLSKRNYTNSFHSNCLKNILILN